MPTMKWIALLGFILLKVTTHAQSDAELVSGTFIQYQAALMNEKGEEVVKYLDNQSLAYFKELLTHIRAADSLMIESLSSSDKMNILMIRHLASKKEILSFTSKTLAIFAFHHGFGNKEDLNGAQLGKIKFVDSFAQAPLLRNHKKSGVTYYFTKSNNLWYINILPLMKESDKEFEELIASTGRTENELILGLLELMSDKKTSPEIWKSVK